MTGLLRGAGVGLPRGPYAGVAATPRGRHVAAPPKMGAGCGGENRGLAGVLAAGV